MYPTLFYIEQAHTPLPGFRICPNSTSSYPFLNLGSKQRWWNLQQTHHKPKRVPHEGSQEFSRWLEKRKPFGVKKHPGLGDSWFLDLLLFLCDSKQFPSPFGSKFPHHFSKEIGPDDP